VRQPRAAVAAGKLSIKAMADNLNRSATGRGVCLVRLPIGWKGAYCEFSHSLDYLVAAVRLCGDAHYRCALTC